MPRNHHIFLGCFQVRHRNAISSMLLQCRQDKQRQNLRRFAWSLQNSEDSTWLPTWLPKCRCCLHTLYMRSTCSSSYLLTSFQILSIPRNGTSVPSFENDCHAHHSRVPKPSWNVSWPALGSNQPVHFLRFRRCTDADILCRFFPFFSLSIWNPTSGHVCTIMHMYASSAATSAHVRNKGQNSK